MAMLIAGLCLVSCTSEDLDEYMRHTEDPDLTDLDVLMTGVPQRGDSDYPADIKADFPLPKQYFDLLESQSPVKDQGNRGICSVFSVVSYMEHLYKLAGVSYRLDFSEQYLQWSTKVQLGAHSNIMGSTASKNIEAVNVFGIVAEEEWPYEPSPWDKSDDSDCDRTMEMPTKCYTNGDPPPETLYALKWYLPEYRWVSSNAESIKAFMYNNKIGVVAGGTFFYQAWSYRKSELPINEEYRKKGYVITPNDEDYEKSMAKRGGHSFLIVGWDDNMEVPRLDMEGRSMYDEHGFPVVEKGFFLFKNSWGTSDWGSENPKGAGYGWMSYKYVYDHIWVGASGVPETGVLREFNCNDGQDNDDDGNADCDDIDCFSFQECQGTINFDVEIDCYDGRDNDDDGYADCDDFDCSDDPACKYKYEYRTYENNNEYSIPDNDPTGITSSIYIFQYGQIIEFQLILNITHAYIYDLEVHLETPAGTDIIVTRASEEGWEQGEKHVFNLVALKGEELYGNWALTIIDTGGQDVGTLNGWKVMVKI
jgi:hypothetical protein